MPEGEITIDDPRAADVRELLVTFFGYREGGRLLAVGALKRLSDEHAEVKSMHTAEEARGRGIGRAMVDHLVAVARERGFARVSLETGTGSAFASARSMYASAGFEPCAPFGDYSRTANNFYMTLALQRGRV